MTAQITYRRAEPGDINEAYAVFRRSLFEYLFRQALVDEATAKDPPIEESWRRQSAWIEHLWHNSAENWVATDGGGKIIGWALSIEREGHLELTHFFVEPGVQTKGIGRNLITRAFPKGRGHHRSIIATLDARALAIYLRAGVSHVATSADFLIEPRRMPSAADVTFVRASDFQESVSAIAVLEREILGFAREVDVKFLMARRPAWLAFRHGKAIGFAFGVEPRHPEAADMPAMCGPIAAADPSDMPTLIDHVSDQAAQAGAGHFMATVPLCNQSAVLHLLAIGAKIDPFYVNVLSSSSSLKLDRWILTSPSFII